MRQISIYVIVGGRGSGKTTFLEKTIKKNALIIQLFLDERYKNFEKIKYDDLQINKKLCNRQIVLEDATQIISSNATNLFKQLLISCKQLGSDIFVVFHSFSAIPPFLWTIFDKIIIFECAKYSKPNQYSAEYFSEIYSIQKRKTPKYKIKGVVDIH